MRDEREMRLVVTDIKCKYSHPVDCALTAAISQAPTNVINPAINNFNNWGKILVHQKVINSSYLVKNRGFIASIVMS